MFGPTINTDKFDNMLIRFNQEEMIDYLMINDFIPKEKLCGECLKPPKFVKFNNVKDGYCFRCYNTGCASYLKRISVRKGSFFENLNLEFI